MGKVLWFTGLSGSGKSTLAHALKNRLEEQGKRVLLLDGDEVRALPGRDVGFSREAIRTNNQLVAEHAKEKSEINDIILVSVIAPYQEDRTATRKILGEKYIEVFVDCPLSVCEERDVKGLYKKARAGEIKNFIGVHENNPYKNPTSPDVVIKTDRVNIQEGIALLLKFLDI